MKPLKAISAALSLILGLTSMSGMMTVFAADDAAAPAAAVQTAENKITYDDILEIGSGVRKLRSIFDEYGLNESKGNKLWLAENVKALLEKNQFPAVLLNAEKFSVTSGEADAIKAADPLVTICQDQGIIWTLDKPGSKITIPWDRFNVKIKTVQTPAANGQAARTYCECAFYPFAETKYDEYVEKLTAMLNYLQLQTGFEGFAYEDVRGRFWGTDTEMGDCYQIPGLSDLDAFRCLTTEEVQKLFTANNLTEEKGYQIWTDETVSAALKDNKFPAVILYPEKFRVPQNYVDELLAEAEHDPNVTVLVDEGNIMWDMGYLDDLIDNARNYTLRWKSYLTEPDAYKPGYNCFCKLAIVPFIDKEYSAYVAHLREVLNYVQLSPSFAGFYYENLNEAFYGQSKLLDDGYLLPDWCKFDVLTQMTTEEVQEAFRQDGETEERGYKVWTAEDVLASLDKGEFPSVRLRPEYYNVDEYSRQCILDENPDAVFTEDQGMCWSHDRLYMFLDMPHNRYTLKVKTIVVNPPPEHPNAVKDYYGQWVMIPNGAATRAEYAKAVADALNMAQIYGGFIEFGTEKLDEDFFGSETVPENQYQIPGTAVAAKQMLVSRPSGDVNEDGSADVADAVLIARFVTEDATVQITEKGLAAADVDNSGNVTQNDLTTLLMRIAKKIK